MFLVWAVSLLRRRSECPWSLGVIIYFGLVWYLISVAPLMAISQSPHHLYVPSVGPCIATAFLAVPLCAEPRKRVRVLRLLGAGFLICICAGQLWKANEQAAVHAGGAGRAQLATALSDIPKHVLVIVWFPQDEPGMLFPYALQEPFSPSDLYSRVDLIEIPHYLYCCPTAQWWQKTRLTLAPHLAGPAGERIDVRMFIWDGLSGSFRQRTRSLSRRLLRAYSAGLLAAPTANVEFFDEAETSRREQAFAKLICEGSSGPMP
jgi:hypothetical protein